MKPSACLLSLLVALAVGSLAPAADPALNTLSAAEKAAGWKLLFDGHSLDGWHIYAKTTRPGSGWQVEGGVLKKLRKQRGGDIVTDAVFGDFDLAWEWRFWEGGEHRRKYLVAEGGTC